MVSSLDVLKTRDSIGVACEWLGRCGEVFDSVKEICKHTKYGQYYFGINDEEVYIKHPMADATKIPLKENLKLASTCFLYNTGGVLS